MLLEQLVITDFRVFRGQNIFDLTPREKWNRKQPIVLFGGLNGTGKTSILSAIRLSLYGRRSLGKAISQKTYEEYLIDCIHQSRDSILQPKYASIDLVFSYSHQGVKNHYKVSRSWTVNNRKVDEDLSIYKDDKKLETLTYEQCQGFLTELIPVGISELFFFDGEKIAELAEDSTGASLADAVKKLLGLDIIERLRADLSLLSRTKNKTTFTIKDKQEIEQLEAELRNEEKLAQVEQQEYEATRVALHEQNKKLEQLNNELVSRGGAWASGREDAITKQVNLISEKNLLEKQIRELVSGTYPFALAPELTKRVTCQLNNETKLKEYLTTTKVLTSHHRKLRKEFINVLGKSEADVINKVLKGELQRFESTQQNTEMIHDVSDTTLFQIKTSFQSAFKKSNLEITRLSEQLNILKKDLYELELTISRAPDEATLNRILNKIKNANERRYQIYTKMESRKETAKKHYRSAIELAQKITTLYEKLIKENERLYSTQHIDSAKSLLSEFSKKAAQKKVKDLEHEFSRSFRNLSRKDDANLKADINPETYSVTLTDTSERIIKKDELSAGEKQIYAISILEALAKTSGRHLPIIIDTPLGRLDSKHRSKLINNYFPYVSHQVIILSTDTEVDEESYLALDKHISHAYKLDYDTKSGSTSSSQGYFWR